MRNHFSDTSSILLQKVSMRNHFSDTSSILLQKFSMRNHFSDTSSLLLQKVSMRNHFSDTSSLLLKKVSMRKESLKFTRNLKFTIISCCLPRLPQRIRHLPQLQQVAPIRRQTRLRLPLFTNKIRKYS
jgi:hypothetical protein